MAKLMHAEEQGSKNPFSGNIPKYFSFVIFRGLAFGLIVATWVIYLQRLHGLSLTQVTFVDVAFWIAATLGEVPTGVVADSYGRKVSLAIGSAILCASTLAWALAPTVPLLVIAYAFLAIGVTFLSGAEDAFFFESLKVTGRILEYTKLAGRVAALSVAASAAGNLASGFLASVDLRLPFLVAGLCQLAMFAIVLTFREPKSETASGEESSTEGSARVSYWSILKAATSILRERPPLRYMMFYLTLLPMAAMILETVFLQPQAIALGIPLAGIGIVVMAMRFANMAGSASSNAIKVRIGEAWAVFLAPFVIAASLLLLAGIQQVPALAFAATISFVTAALRPIVMNRIQNEVSDTIRATVLSFQSLLFAFVALLIEPLLGFVADQAGLPMAYIVLAIALSALSVLLFWRSRSYFPA
jgi:MFS family permease